MALKHILPELSLMHSLGWAILHHDRFSIDVSIDVIKTVQQILSLSEPGGILINLGPLDIV